MMNRATKSGFGLPWLASALRRALVPWTTLAAEMESARQDLTVRRGFAAELHVFLAHAPGCAQCRLPAGMLRQLIEDCVPGGTDRPQSPLWIWTAARRAKSVRRGAPLILEITCRSFARPVESQADCERALRRRLARHFGRRAGVDVRAHSPGCSIYSISLPQPFAGRASVSRGILR
jgi:hypothetical protein